MRANLVKSSPWLLALILAVLACQPTRYVPEGKYLLRNDPALKTEGKVPENALEDAIRLEANRRVLLSRLYLGFYNLGRRLQEDSSRVKTTLLKVDKLKSAYESTTGTLTGSLGEAPAIVSEATIRADTQQLRTVCFAYGYFHPVIDYRIDTLRNIYGYERGEAQVTYTVQPGAGYRVRRSQVLIQDSLASDSLLSLMEWDNSLIKVNQVYRQQSLVQERARLSDALRDHGYFTFSPAAISYYVDTLTNGEQSAAIRSGDYRWIDVRMNIDSLPPRYTISEIRVQIKADANLSDSTYHFVEAIRADRLNAKARSQYGLSQRRLADSVDMTFVVERPLLEKLNFNFIAARVHLQEGATYSQELSRLTQRRLQELGMFRYVILKFEVNERRQTLRVLMELQMAPHYQIKAGMESFYNGLNSFGNNLPSIGGNISLRNRNTFDRSELLEAGLQGSLGFYSAEAQGPAAQSLFYTVGTQASLNMPSLLFPLAGRRDFSRLSPSTQLSADATLDQRQEFQRFKVGARTSYRWNHIPFSTLAVSEFTPLALEYIDTRTDSTFQANVVDRLPPAIRRDFEQRVSSRLQYAFTYQDYRSTRARPTSWSRLVLEVGGNLPNLADNVQAFKQNVADTSSQDNLLFGRLFYGQYVKASAEVKYLLPFRNGNDLIFRVFLGGSVPFNSTPTVPRESRFFSGGPNSMRGWRSNTLGPGTLSLEDLAQENGEVITNGLSLVAPGGEWIFEANAEYRFMVLPPYVEMGLFTDLGNVWFHNSKATIEQLGEKAVISPENLKLGWDVGAGIRFDFDFVIFRVDFGQQLHAPDVGWIIGNPNVIRRPEPSIGVDYPF